MAVHDPTRRSGAYDQIKTHPELGWEALEALGVVHLHVGMVPPGDPKHALAIRNQFSRRVLADMSPSSTTPLTSRAMNSLKADDVPRIWAHDGAARAIMSAIRQVYVFGPMISRAHCGSLKRLRRE